MGQGIEFGAVARSGGRVGGGTGGVGGDETVADIGDIAAGVGHVLPSMGVESAMIVGATTGMAVAGFQCGDTA